MKIRIKSKLLLQVLTPKIKRNRTRELLVPNLLHHAAKSNPIAGGGLTGSLLESGHSRVSLKGYNENNIYEHKAQQVKAVFKAVHNMQYNHMYKQQYKSQGIITSKGNVGYQFIGTGNTQRTSIEG